MTPARLTPTVSTWVAGLRLAGYAWIIGHNIFSQVAESTWAGIDSQGLLIHTSTLYHNNTPWPDVFPADIVSISCSKTLCKERGLKYSEKLCYFEI